MLVGWGLLLFLSLLMAISTFLPRTPQDMMSFAEGNGSIIMDFLFEIGVYEKETFQFKIVDTWLFKALILVIFLFLVKALMKFIFKCNFWEDQTDSKTLSRYSFCNSRDELKSFLEYSLKKSGFKIQFKTNEIIALKEVTYKISIITIHVGLILILLGGVYSYVNFEKGSLYLPQGEKISSSQIEGLGITNDFELKAETIWPEYYSLAEYDGAFNGLVKDFYAKLKIYFKDKEISTVASTSQKVKVDHFQFFLTDFGATGVITIKNKQGREFNDIFPVEYKQGSLFGSYITKDNTGISIAYSGIPDEKGIESFKYYFYEYTANGWQKSLEGEQDLFKPILYKGNEFIFLDINRVAKFTVVKTNPVVFYIGVCILVVGLVLFLGAKRTKLSFIFNNEQQLQIEGWGMPDKNHLYQQIKILSEQMGWEEI